MVTGGCGFIASNFLNIMKDKYPYINFINVDKLEYCSNVENVNPGVATFVRGDIGNIRYHIQFCSPESCG